MLGRVDIPNDFTAWRDAARQLLAANVSPDAIVFSSPDAPVELLAKYSIESLATSTSEICVSQKFVARAQRVACHRSPHRWNLLYRLLWRLTHNEPHLLELMTDDDVREFDMMDKAVHRDRHKMTAFFRFRRVHSVENSEQYIAWHRPDHFIVRLAAPFFRERFMAMHWTILTPDESVSWDGHVLKFGPGVPASHAPAADELEALWGTYYASIFNPARINLSAMQREMPKKHWATMPETHLIDDLVRAAPKRVEAMIKKTQRISPGKSKAGCENTGSARDFFPDRISLPQLRVAAEKCKGCDLYCNATQVVFGEGAREARVMFVGEQPGDQEDLAVRPFVGPSGQLLDEVLHEVGIDRKRDVYVTNAVKHFKFEMRGKRRLHSKPSAREVAACRPWLEAEIQVIQPKMIVLLGATAAQSLLGSGFRVTKMRGQILKDQNWAPWVMATYHPSALLRMPDQDARRAARIEFVSDLKKVATQIQRDKTL